jgi:hypothetical protein
MTDRVGTAVKAHCSKCGGERNCEVKGHHPERGGDDDYQWHVDWYLLACRGCDHVFAQTTASNSEDYYNYYDERGETVTEHIESVETWPARSKRPVPEWFEHSLVETDLENTSALNASLKELYRALEADLMVLSSMGIRTSFDIAAELLGVNSALRFNEKIDALVAGGHIAEAEKGHIEILVDAGSASAHRGWKPQASDVDALMTALEEFIYNSIVFPSRKRAQAAKLAEVGAKVPKRLARPKKAKDQS